MKFLLDTSSASLGQNDSNSFKLNQSKHNTSHSSIGGGGAAADVVGDTSRLPFEMIKRDTNVVSSSSTMASINERILGTANGVSNMCRQRHDGSLALGTSASNFTLSSLSNNGGAFTRVMPQRPHSTNPSAHNQRLTFQQIDEFKNRAIQESSLLNPALANSPCASKSEAQRAPAPDPTIALNQ